MLTWESDSKNFWFHTREEYSTIDNFHGVCWWDYDDEQYCFVCPMS